MKFKHLSLDRRLLNQWELCLHDLCCLCLTLTDCSLASLSSAVSAANLVVSQAGMRDYQSRMVGSSHFPQPGFSLLSSLVGKSVSHSLQPSLSHLASLDCQSAPSLLQVCLSSFGNLSSVPSPIPYSPLLPFFSLFRIFGSTAGPLSFSSMA